MAIGGVFIPTHPGIGEDFAAGEAEFIPKVQAFKQNGCGLIELPLIRGDFLRQRLKPVKVGLPSLIGGVNIFEFPAGFRRDFTSGRQFGRFGRLAAGAGKQHGADQ